MISHDGIFDSLIASAATAGYEMEVTWDDEIPQIYLHAKEKFVPAINVKTQVVDDNMFSTFQFKLSFDFPHIDCPSPELEWSDSMEYISRLWTRVGKFATKLLEFTYDPRQYEE